MDTQSKEDVMASQFFKKPFFFLICFQRDRMFPLKENFPVFLLRC